MTPRKRQEFSDAYDASSKLTFPKTHTSVYGDLFTYEPMPIKQFAQHLNNPAIHSGGSMYVMCKLMMLLKERGWKWFLTECAENKEFLDLYWQLSAEEKEKAKLYASEL